MPAQEKSKTAATWLAVIGGGIGLHRFYLHGLKDWIGWLHPLPTLLGWIGWQRVQSYGQDDRLAWLLLPLGGLSVSAAMLMAIVYGLTPDERWDARYRPAASEPSGSGWAAVVGVIVALLLGATVLLSSITYALQRLFEAQV
ncbi:MAG: TM2 domain-containing protein [Burkholderiales bacterium]